MPNPDSREPSNAGGGTADGSNGSPEVMQLDQDLAGEGFGFQVNPLIGAAMIGVLHDIAGRFVDRQLRLGNAVFVERRPGR